MTGPNYEQPDLHRILTELVIKTHEHKGISALNILAAYDEIIATWKTEDLRQPVETVWEALLRPLLDSVDGSCYMGKEWEETQVDIIKKALRQPVETVGFQDATLKMRIREQIANQFGVVSGEQVDNVFAVVKPIIEALRTQPHSPIGHVEMLIEQELRTIDRLAHYETVAPPWDTFQNISNAVMRIRQALRQPVETVGYADFETWWDKNGVTEDDRFDPKSLAMAAWGQALRTQPQAPVVEVPTVDELHVAYERGWAGLENHYDKLDGALIAIQDLISLLSRTGGR